MIELYINDQLVELTDDIKMSVTKCWDDLQNPTNIKSDWSKTISIPESANNNRIFSGINKVESAYLPFNPRVKFNFRIEYNTSPMMTGYGRVASIKTERGKTTYEVNLFGDLGRILSDLRKLTFTDTDSEYYIAPNEIVGTSPYTTTINRGLINEMWLTDNLPTGELSGSTINNTFGMLPTCNAYNPEFDSQSVQAGASKSQSFVELLQGSADFRHTGVSADSVVGDGLLPREFNEYRSYYLQPYVYVKRLWQILVAKAAKMGYEIDLDSAWFNDNVSYYRDLIMLLNPAWTDFSKYDEQANANGITSSAISYTINEDKTRVRTTWLNCTSNDSDYIIVNSPMTINASSKIVRSNGAIGIRLDATASGAAVGSIYLNNKNALYVTLEVRGAMSNILFYSQRYAVCSNDVIVSPSYGTDDINNRTKIVVDGTTISGGHAIFDFTIPYAIGARHGQPIRLSISTKWANNSEDCFNKKTVTNTINAQFGDMSFGISEPKRTGSEFSMRRFWDKDVNFLDVMLNYCKMFRMVVTAVGNRLSIRRPSTYFMDITYIDWNEKVDYSRDFVISPIAFDSRYIKYNYDDGNDELSEVYKAKYGSAFGSYTIDNAYPYNEDSTELFSGVRNTPIQSQSVMLWWDAHSGNIRYRNDPQKYPCLGDSSNKAVTAFGSLMFHGAFVNNTWVRRVAPILSSQYASIPSIHITDDTPFQVGNDNYMYIDAGQSDLANYIINATKMPLVSSVDWVGGMSLFAKPMESYDGETYEGARGIYEQFWQKYIEERYAYTNRIVTCYVWLKNTDWQNFEFHKIVRIGNVTYFVNKIIDYDFDESTPTKVELISIADVTALK